VATFKKAGSYVFKVTVMDPSGQTASSSVSVTVNQTISFIAVTPGSVTLTKSGEQQYTAVAKDLFNNPLATQPAFTWSATGGTLSSALYTAGTTVGTYQVSVSASGKTGKGTVTIN
jgi:hypothetical protein